MSNSEYLQLQRLQKNKASKVRGPAMVGAKFELEQEESKRKHVVDLEARQSTSYPVRASPMQKSFHSFLLLQKVFQKLFCHWSKKLFDRRVGIHQPLIAIVFW